MTQPEVHEDSRDSGSLTSRLRHVYWIGGASGSGKSAPRLADKHGLWLYSTDEAMGGRGPQEVRPMRFLPSIRYGTEGYPEKIARRLRGVNLSAWLGAAVTGGAALSQSFASAPGLWKAAMANGLAALALVFTPLLHRFGPVAAPVAVIMTAYALIFALTMLFGTESGIHRFYQLFPALVILAIGLEHIRLVFGLVALGIAMAVVVTLAAPMDSGLLSATRLFYGDIVVFTVAGSVGLFLTVLYAFRQVARSEAAAEREAERAEAANKHKSHFLASASHDLRQPLHALNLFVARLRSESDPAERSWLIARTAASPA